ncbi:PAS domain-containing protein [Oceanibaculum indicum]|uniref:PAS domain-containing protein n=1 Tax=Oceanibaculum indicum TaxID=526216 RepID=UPI00178C7CA1|nr:PAS domain-containing protein [Oceanibaculum indicum]
MTDQTGNAKTETEMRPTIRRLLRLWRAQRDRHGGALPRRQDFDPLELGPKLLPYVSIVELDGGRLRFRLCGTGLAKAAGLDLTGAYVDELNPNKDYARYITGLYEQARIARLPLLSESVFIGALEVAKGRTQRLICPLAQDGERVDHFIGTQVFEKSPDSVGDLTMTYAAGFAPGLTRVIGDEA